MEEKEIDLIDIKDILYNMWQKRFLIIVLFLVGIILGVLYTMFIVDPKYKSTTKLVLASTSTKDEAAITTTDLTINSKLISTYTEIVKSRSVAEHVISELNLDMSVGTFISNISIYSKTNTDTIEISVLNEDPKQAANIANKIAEVFIEKVKEIYKIENVSVIDKAIESGEPANVKLPKNIAIFSFGGIAIACVIVFLSMVFDTTVKDQEDVERLLDIPVIAVIPKMED